jgi:plasmid stabilization system protein ParE
VFNVELLIQAENELAEAYDWYEEQQPTVGDKFYKEIDYYLGLLEKDPHLFAIRYTEELRAVALNKFPFLIIYWVDEASYKVYVVSVFHTSRNPKY